MDARASQGLQCHCLGKEAREPKAGLSLACSLWLQTSTEGAPWPGCQLLYWKANFWGVSAGWSPLWQWENHTTPSL